MSSGGQVIATIQITFNDFFYSEDPDTGAASGTGTPGFTEGQLASVTVLAWARSADPEVHIGRPGSPFVDETDQWIPLEAFRDGDFWAQTWYRPTTAAMVSSADIEVQFSQPPLDMAFAGTDGAQVWVNRWADGFALERIYAVATSGTEHLPPTTDTGVLNFYLAGGGVTTDLSAPRFPTIPGPSGISNHGVVLDDNAVGDLDHRELFGAAAYQPFDQPVEAWVTEVAQAGIMYGVADPFIVEAGDAISGVVRGLPIR